MLSHLRGKRSSFQVSLDVHASRGTKRQSVKNELINQLVRLSGSGGGMQLCFAFLPVTCLHKKLNPTTEGSAMWPVVAKPRHFSICHPKRSRGVSDVARGRETA